LCLFQLRDRVTLSLGMDIISIEASVHPASAWFIRPHTFLGMRFPTFGWVVGWH
jgi:hypothetical protein